MGGSSNSAQKQADKNERERQAQIAKSTAAINGIFEDPARQATYDKLAQDTTQFYVQDLNKQKETTDRQSKFALARSGNIGGSLQADTGRRIGEEYNKGLVETTRRGNAAGAALRGQDESSRMSLLGMAQAGLDATTAGSQAASSLRGNLQAGMADATASGLGDLFGNVADIQRRSRDQSALNKQRLYDYRTIYASPYGGGP